jgi:NADPH:quinone reductase
MPPRVGDGVHSVQPGQRVAWVYAPGSYAERIALSADALIHVPDVIDDRTAAAVMMQGLTASHFATNFYCVQPQDVALVHAAAGGLGLLLTQIIKLRAGRVIGRVQATAGSLVTGRFSVTWRTQIRAEGSKQRRSPRHRTPAQAPE